MAAMHYVGNFNAERGQLNAINETITTELASIEKTIEGMNSYWKDEKSADFIASVKEWITEVKSEQAKAIEGGNEILSKVESALNVYTN